MGGGKGRGKELKLAQWGEKQKGVVPSFFVEGLLVLVCIQHKTSTKSSFFFNLSATNGRMCFLAPQNVEKIHSKKRNLNL